MKEEEIGRLMMEECTKQIREGDFLHDFKVFLRYVEKEKIKLTPKMRLIPFKHVKNINSLFRQPEPIEHRVGDRVFKKRYEYELPRLHFIGLLADAAGCLKATARGNYKKGPNFNDFWESDLFKRIGALFIIWWDCFSWGVFYPYGSDFADSLQERRGVISPILKKTIGMRKVDVEGFTAKVVKATGVKWNCAAGDPDDSLAKWAVEGIILRAMSFFGAVELFQGEKGEYGIKKTVAFSLTEPLGKWLVSLLPLPGPTNFS